MPCKAYIIKLNEGETVTGFREMLIGFKEHSYWFYWLYNMEFEYQGSRYVCLEHGYDYATPSSSRLEEYAGLNREILYGDVIPPNRSRNPRIIRITQKCPVYPVYLPITTLVGEVADGVST